VFAKARGFSVRLPIGRWEKFHIIKLIEKNMKCPHCLENFNSSWKKEFLSKDKDGGWFILFCKCTNEKCDKLIVKLLNTTSVFNTEEANKEYLVYPKGVSRTPLSEVVPEQFTGDYLEACLVLSDSPKASAALSRRCLQNILKKKACTTKKDLNGQIQEVLDSKFLPSYLADAIDAIRNIGNFATHPIKSISTGEIVDVEVGEAEWNLDVLEQLFDFYFVQPSILEEKRKSLNEKLKDVGKPEMK